MGDFPHCRKQSTPVLPLFLRRVIDGYTKSERKAIVDGWRFTGSLQTALSSSESKRKSLVLFLFFLVRHLRPHSFLPCLASNPELPVCISINIHIQILVWQCVRTCVYIRICTSVCMCLISIYMWRYVCTRR